MLRLRSFGPFLLTLPLAAQMHHVDKPERVTRAIGVYEWTGDLAKPDAARLIPVSVFINSHYEDAGVFLAEPIPLALETGTVYALQHSGNTIGTVDLDFARDIVDKRSTGDDNPLGAWYGYGRFFPLSAEPAPSKLTEHSGKPVVIDGGSDDGEPHFVRSRHPNDADSSSSTAKGTSPAPADDPDRPKMARRDSDSTDNAPSSPGTADIDNDPDRPTLGHRDDAEQDSKKKHKKESDSGVEAMPTSLNDDPDRPELHRGKVASLSAPAQLTGLPSNVHQVIAVSDAANVPPHVFSREWDSSIERAQTLAAMQKLANPLARQYLATNHLTPGTSAGPKLVDTSSSKGATTATSAPGAHTTPRTMPHAIARRSVVPVPISLPFTDEQISGYTLSYGGLPTFVYSAAVPTKEGPPVRLTIVAQRLPSGELQTSLSSVTDEAHLDRTPWMRLVDAVDPDESHRASLLFELRAHSSRQFALYSLASAQAQQTFVTGVIE